MVNIDNTQISPYCNNKIIQLIINRKTSSKMSQDYFSKITLNHKISPQSKMASNLHKIVHSIFLELLLSRIATKWLFRNRANLYYIRRLWSHNKKPKSHSQLWFSKINRLTSFRINKLWFQINKEWLSKTSLNSLLHKIRS